MTTDQLVPGTIARLDKHQLQEVINRLRELDYRTIGPQVRDGAIVFDDITSVEQLPVGQLDIQDGGTYRLHSDPDAGWFDHVVGPHSLKNYLFPPREPIQQLTLDTNGWQAATPEVTTPPVAFIGTRACDLHALAIQDRVFLEGPYVDPQYKARRERLFVIAVNCRRAAATCFCHSMSSGPKVSSSFDLALTELDDEFTVEIGTLAGAEVIQPLSFSICTSDEVEQSRQVSQDLLNEMRSRTAQPDSPRPRQLKTEGIRDVLMQNLDHARWDDVAQRCLACANCTMVCPTCFCSTVGEVTDLPVEHVTRERTWASCFTGDHSYTASGVVRPSIKSQYRQWLTHKLATWVDQFGFSGCVGCGRCITWCPVGIDLTEEVAAIRREDA